MSKPNEIVGLAVRVRTLHPPSATAVAVNVAVKLRRRARESLLLITTGKRLAQPPFDECNLSTSAIWRWQK
jgi:hypothetical protein